jgi:hypothetical protein
MKGEVLAEAVLCFWAAYQVSRDLSRLFIAVVVLI